MVTGIEDEFEFNGDEEDPIGRSALLTEVAVIEEELYRLLDRNRYYNDPITREDIERIHGDLVRIEARFRGPNG